MEVEEKVGLGCIAGGCLVYFVYICIVLTVLIGGAILIWQNV